LESGTVAICGDGANRKILMPNRIIKSNIFMNELYQFAKKMSNLHAPAGACEPGAGNLGRAGPVLFGP
jgi:hypothetical protein